MSTITWLHLSDLHFRVDEQHTWDENIILKALLTDIAERREQDGLHPDFIIVTGDIAFSGKPAEYGLARTFLDELLQATSLGKDRLFLVPGNHDVDRDLVSRGAQIVGDTLNDRESTNAVLAKPVDRRLMLARFQGYTSFINTYLAEYYSFDDERYFYVRTLDLAGKRLALLGLNSAWVSASDQDKVKGLLLGERQVQTVLSRTADADLRIVLLHHPFDWLREFDRDDVESLLCDKCDFVLHGHMHRIGLLQARTPDGAATIIAAGAFYVKRRYPNSYNFVRLDLTANTGSVHLRRYSDERGGFWARDTLTYRNVPDGVFRFPLYSAPMPGRLGSSPSVTSFVVGFPPNPDFVGRQVDLQRLHNELSQAGSSGGATPTVLVGLGGVGKTQLAAEYAHAHRDDYLGGIYWLNAANPLLQEFAALAEPLGLADRETPVERAAHQVWSYLDARPDALVVFDDVVEPSQLNIPFAQGLIPANLRCRTMFTTRRRDFPRGFKPFEVKVLPKMDAMHLVLRARREVLDEHHPDWPVAQAICASLGYLPLALELAAAYLETYPDVTLIGYLDRLRMEGALTTVDDTELRSEDLPTRHAPAITATLRTQWNRLDDENARLLFRVAGQLPQAAWVPIARLGFLAGIKAELSSGRAAPLIRSLNLLHNASLVEELTGDRVQLHPLVHQFAALQISEADTARFREWCASNLMNAYRDVAVLEHSILHRPLGIDDVLADLQEALTLCPERTDLASSLRAFHRLLDLEAHNLRDSQAAKSAGFVLQQIQNRAASEGMSDYALAIAEELRSRLTSRLSLHHPIARESPALIRTLRGHTDAVYACALTPNGKKIISGSQDGTLRVWELATGRELAVMTVGSPVHDCSVTLDGQTAISVGHGYHAGPLAWNLTTGEGISFEGREHGDSHSCALTPDGSQLVVTHDKDVTLWDLATRKELHMIEGGFDSFLGHQEWVYDCAIAPDGRHVITVSWDRSIKLWKLARNRLEPLDEFGLFEALEKMYACAISPDGTKVVVGARDGTLKVFDFSRGDRLFELKDHKDAVYGCTVTPDSKYVISASWDETLKVWDLGTGQLVSTLVGHSFRVNDCVTTPDGKYLVSASQDATLKIWNMDRIHEPLPKRHHDGGVGRCLVTHDGKRAITSSVDGTKVWDIETGAQIMTPEGYIRSITPDGMKAISACSDGTLRIWSLETGIEVACLKREREVMGDCAVTQDGRYLVSWRGPLSGGDSFLQVWDMTTLEELLTWKEGNSDVSHCTLTPDGTKILLGIHSDFVRGDLRAVTYVLDLSSAADGRLNILHVLPRTHEAENCAVTADGKHLISVADDDVSLRVWNLETGELVTTLSGHNKTVERFATSPDGKHIASVSAYGVIKVWNCTTWTELVTLTGHKWKVLACAFTPDGQYIVSGSHDRTLRVWSVPDGCEVARLEAAADIQCLAVAPNSRDIIAGDSLGNIYFLEFTPAP